VKKTRVKIQKSETIRFEMEWKRMSGKRKRKMLKRERTVKKDKAFKL